MLGGPDDKAFLELIIVLVLLGNSSDHFIEYFASAVIGFGSRCFGG